MAPRQPFWLTKRWDLVSLWNVESEEQARVSTVSTHNRNWIRSRTHNQWSSGSSGVVFWRLARVDKPTGGIQHGLQSVLQVYRGTHKDRVTLIQLGDDEWSKDQCQQGMLRERPSHATDLAHCCKTRSDCVDYLGPHGDSGVELSERLVYRRHLKVSVEGGSRILRDNPFRIFYRIWWIIVFLSELLVASNIYKLQCVQNCLPRVVLQATLGDRAFPVAAARNKEQSATRDSGLLLTLTLRRETKSHLFRQSYGWRGAVHSDGQQTSVLSCAAVLDIDFVKCPCNHVIGSTIILTFVVVKTIGRAQAK